MWLGRVFFLLPLGNLLNDLPPTCCPLVTFSIWISKSCADFLICFDVVYAIITTRNARVFSHSATNACHNRHASLSLPLSLSLGHCDSMNGNRSLCPNPHLDRHALNPYFAIFMFFKLVRRDKIKLIATLVAAAAVVGGARACESVPSTKLSVHGRCLALGFVCE